MLMPEATVNEDDFFFFGQRLDLVYPVDLFYVACIYIP